MWMFRCVSFPSVPEISMTQTTLHILWDFVVWKQKVCIFSFPVFYNIYYIKSLCIKNKQSSDVLRCPYNLTARPHTRGDSNYQVGPSRTYTLPSRNLFQFQFSCQMIMKPAIHQPSKCKIEVISVERSLYLDMRQA